MSSSRRPCIALTCGAPGQERPAPPQGPGAEPPERNLWNQKDRHSANKPGPHVHGDPGLAARLQEYLPGLSQRATVGQLGQLPQRCLIHPEVPELLSIRYH
jgi:hypothetical protein